MIDWTDPARVAASVDALLTWKRVWGERVGKQGHWLYSEQYRNFLVAWLCTKDAEVTGYAIVVTVDDAPIAVAVFCTDACAATGIIASFDSAFAKWSPGALAVEDLCEMGVRSQHGRRLRRGLRAIQDLLVARQPELLLLGAKASIPGGAWWRFPRAAGRALRRSACARSQGVSKQK